MSTLEKSIHEVLDKLSQEVPRLSEVKEQMAGELATFLIASKDPAERKAGLKEKENILPIVLCDLVHHYARAQWRQAIQAALGSLPQESALPPSFTE